MLPKSVSPRFVGYTTIPVGILLSTPIVLLAEPLTQQLPKVANVALRLAFFSCAFRISYFLVRKVFSYLGIAVRSRSVERFQATHRDDEEAAIELPIRIPSRPMDHLGHVMRDLSLWPIHGVLVVLATT